MARSLSGQNRQDDWAAVDDHSPRRIHQGIGVRPERFLRTFIVAVEGPFSKSTAKIPVDSAIFGSLIMGTPLRRRGSTSDAEMPVAGVQCHGGIHADRAAGQR